jgi:hypothetical protein
MNSGQKRHPARQASSGEAQGHTQLLLLPDGRILVHNLTPAMAEILQQIAPDDLPMQQRRRLASPCRPGGNPTIASVSSSQ